MARKRMVTRTIEGSNVTVLGLDIVKAEPCNATVTFPCVYKDDKKLLEACKTALDTDTFKVVSVVSVDVFEELYGMSEDDFMKYSHKLPPRTKLDQTRIPNLPTND